MKTVQIKHRFTGAILYSTEVEDDDPYPIRTAITDANLARANLTGAYLAGAYLAGAYLARAYLARANLTGAYLADANLTGANLAGANLARANLADANLADANLARANLAGIRDDFRAVLDTSPAEVVTLLVKLRAGEIDGSQYQGECACLVGTIAIARNERYDGMPQLKPDQSRPSERWFLGIRVGDTPSTSQIAAITDDWICEWQAERGEGDWHTEAM